MSQRKFFHKDSNSRGLFLNKNEINNVSFLDRMATFSLEKNLNIYSEKIGNIFFQEYKMFLFIK
jgi:hypothetical protein